MLRARPIAVFVLAAIGCATGWEPAGSIPGAHRRNLAGDPSEPGAFRFQLKVPAGARAEAHKHSIDVHVRVLSGSMVIIVGEPLDASRARTYPAGSAFVVPAGAWHVEWWDEATILEAEGIGPMTTTRAGTLESFSAVKP